MHDVNEWKKNRKSLLDEQFEKCKRSKEKIEELSSIKNELEEELIMASHTLRRQVSQELIFHLKT